MIPVEGSGEVTLSRAWADWESPEDILYDDLPDAN